jgi:long-chain acyl-CoA synthetase
MVNRLSRHADSISFNKEHLGSIIYGGAPMYLEDIRRSLAVFGPRLVQIYGQGETPNTISYLSQHIHADVSNPHYGAILNSVGVPRMGIEVRVVDEDDRELPAERIGQVLVRSEVTMAGYWNNPGASASTLKDGWLHTGDLGCFDALGYLSLKDRAKDVIISGGSNIYPREVEEVVLLHAGVLETAVIGRPSPEWGEEVIAYVVCREEHKVTAADLDALCLQHIARFKRPKAYRFVDRLPKRRSS